ncbi:hypothetical protein BH09VER1_BH09VER1_53030 [soil metagenome]
MKALWSKLPPFWKYQIGGWAIPVKWALFWSFSGVAVSFYRELLGLLLPFGMYLVDYRIYGHWRISWILFAIFVLSFAGSALETMETCRTLRLLKLRTIAALMMDGWGELAEPA